MPLDKLKSERLSPAELTEYIRERMIQYEINQAEKHFPTISKYRDPVSAERTRIYRLRKKYKVLAAYSEDGTVACKRCGIAEIRVLALHHVNRNGGEDRRSRSNSRGGWVFYQALHKAGYPKDPNNPMIILCANCHLLVGHVTAKKDQ